MCREQDDDEVDDDWSLSDAIAHSHTTRLQQDTAAVTMTTQPTPTDSGKSYFSDDSD